jgi:Zn-dependent protease
MDLARAQRQEDTVVIQEPSSYEYRVTYGAPRRATGRIYFSPKELKHFAAATLLVIGIGLSIGLFSDIFVRTGWSGMSFFAVILTASFLTHEIAHKVTAQRRGLWAEFRLTLWGAALTLISVISPLFKIIAPGAVMISGPARMDEIAKISLAGPIINIAFSSVLALWNGFIALFNLIPIGILDGYKIFSWDKMVWALAFMPSLVLTLIPYVMVGSYM